jgi:hypothetical protein
MQNTEFRTGVIRPVECYKEAWERIKNQYWLLLAITVIGAMIGSGTLYILLGAMICGIFYCYFQAIDGKKVEFEGLFKGFRYFLPGLMVTVIILVPVLVEVGIIYVPLILTAMSGGRISEDELFAMFGAIMVTEVIFSIFMVCLHTLLMFAFPLLVDKNLPAWQAMKTSARAVWANLSGVVGLFVVGFAVSLVGLALACIGVYLVLPLVFAAHVVAYRKIFPASGDAHFAAPPNAF